MKRLGVVCLFLVACETGPPDEPESSAVSIQVENPLELTVTSPLRSAVVWTYADGDDVRFVTTADVPASVDGRVEAPLRMPDDDLVERLTPTEAVDLGSDSGNLSFLVHRPRLIVYEDVDQSQSFEPPVLGSSGPDRVRATDFAPESVAAILDLEAVLEQLPIEKIGAYYGATDGRFTPFLRVQQSGTALQTGLWTPDFNLLLDGSKFPENSLRCLRPLPTRKEVREQAYVDTGIDQALCDDVPCVETALSTIESPEFQAVKTWSVVRAAHCRRIDSVESLYIEKQDIVCEADCSCKADIEITVYIAQRFAGPSWWPCGAMPVCESAESLTEYEPSCNVL